VPKAQCTAIWRAAPARSLCIARTEEEQHELAEGPSMNRTALAQPDDDLPPEQVAYYREVLVTHGSIYGASMCSICGVARCPDWVDAYDRLAAAHQVMAKSPPPWEPLPTRRQR
jgi:hypothetical protein